MFFGVATKNLFMEDLLESSLRATAHPKLLKILPNGANLFQRNAASVKNKGQKMNKNVKSWHSSKVILGF